MFSKITKNHPILFLIQATIQNWQLIRLFDCFHDIGFLYLVIGNVQDNVCRSILSLWFTFDCPMPTFHISFEQVHHTSIVSKKNWKRFWFKFCNIFRFASKTFHFPIITAVNRLGKVRPNWSYVSRRSSIFIAKCSSKTISFQLILQFIRISSPRIKQKEIQFSVVSLNNTLRQAVASSSLNLQPCWVY